MKSLYWTVVLLFLMIYVVAVYLTQLVLDYRVEKSLGGTQPNEQLGQYYSSLFRSILSLYQAISGGVDWDDLVNPLIQEISPLIGLIFTFYIAFSILALMNVVTGVFVESALKNAKEDSDNYMISHARNLFREASGNMGIIRWAQFEAMVGTDQMKEFFSHIGVDVSEAKSIFHLLDVDDSDEIDLDEFLSGCVRLRGPAKAIDVSCLMLETQQLAKRMSSHSSLVEANFAGFMDILPNLVHLSDKDDDTTATADVDGYGTC